MIIARVLPPDEYHRLPAELPGSPLADQDLTQFHGVFLVFEREGRLLAHWPLLLAWHAEPCYIAEAERTNPGLIRVMISGLVETLQQAQIPIAFAITDIPDVSAILGRLGFQQVPGSLYYARANPSPPTESV